VGWRRRRERVCGEGRRRSGWNKEQKGGAGIRN